VNVALLTISDRVRVLLLHKISSYSLTHSIQAFSGVYEDKSGPEMAKLLTEMSETPSWPLQLHIKFTELVPDEPGTGFFNSFTL